MYVDIFFIMELRLFSLILFSIITIKCTESKKEKEKRTFVVKRDILTDKHNLYGYSIFDKTGKRRLYRSKTIYSDIDIMVVVDYPSKNIVVNMEGVLLEGKLNLTFSVYDHQ
jgi:hypothetical protein